MPLKLTLPGTRGAPVAPRAQPRPQPMYAPQMAGPQPVRSAGDFYARVADGADRRRDVIDAATLKKIADALPQIMDGIEKMNAPRTLVHDERGRPIGSRIDWPAKQPSGDVTGSKNG